MHSPIPHILLGPLMIVPFYLPPFPHRGALFTTAILSTVFINTFFNSYPPDRAVRYGLAGSWLYYIPVIEKLLRHNPEHDFWRVDRKPHEAEGMKRWSWEKFRWSVALWASPRGVGWNFQSRRVVPVGNAKSSTGRFVARRLTRSIFSCMVMELVVFAAGRVDPPTELTLETAPRVVLAEAMLATCVLATFTMQIDMLAAVMVGIGLSKPKDWPPLFGDISSATTVANFWGSFWHTLLRQSSLGFSHAIVDYLHLPKKSLLTYSIHLSCGFLLSAVAHVISVLPVVEGHYPVSSICRDSTFFFMGQVVAILFETAVIECYQKWMNGGHSPEKTIGKGYQKKIVTQEIWIPLLGYTWVLSWMAISGWWFVKLYTGIGVLKWRAPIPLAETVLQWFHVI